MGRLVALVAVLVGAGCDGGGGTGRDGGSPVIDGSSIPDAARSAEDGGGGGDAGRDGDAGGDAAPELPGACDAPGMLSGTGQLLTVHDYNYTSVYQNIGTDFREVVTFPTALAIVSAAMGDFDGDGRDDLARGTFDGVTVFRNVETGFVAFDDVVAGAQSLHWFRANPGVREDLFVGQMGGTDALFVSTVNGMARRWTEPVGSSWTLDVDTGDLDGDGDADIAVANDSYGMRIYRKTGFELEPIFVDETSEPPWKGVAWLDRDSDGDLDLAVARPQFAGVGKLVVLDNVGGAFSVGWEADLNVDAGMDAADYDGDGDTDLAVASRGALVPGGSVGVYVLRNDGGEFTPVWQGRQGVPAWGDADLDGDPDLAVGHTLGLTIYANDGGTLCEAVTVERSVNGLAWGRCGNDPAGPPCFR